MHKKLRFRLFISGTVLSVLVAACVCSARAETLLRIGGTGSALPAMRLLAKSYTASHPDTTIRVVPSLGSHGGIAALGHGALDLAVCASPLSDAELSAGATVIEYARTPFVFAVHKDVPKRDLTTEELADILKGKTVNWSDGSFIRLILRPVNDADTQIMKGVSPAVADAVETAHRRAGMMLAATNDESANAISKVPGALAGTTLSEMIAGRRGATILSFNGVKPTLHNLSIGKYPLMKRLYLVMPPKTSAAAREFVRYLKGAQARAILTAAGNLSVFQATGR